MGAEKSIEPAHRASRFGRIGLESLMIILSVLLALFVDDWREDRARADLAEVARLTIIAELKDNRAALMKVAPYHRSLAQTFAAEAAAPRENTPFIEIFGRLAKRGIGRPDVRRTAWELNLQRGAVAEFDYKTAYAFAGIYDLQRDGVDYTWRVIARTLTSAAALDPTATGVTTQSVAFTFQELASQEENLIFVIERTLMDLGESVITPEPQKTSEGA